MNQSVICYIGLGSNLNDPVRQIQAALLALEQQPQIDAVHCSSLYASKPMGPQDQPDYVNAVARLVTGLSADALLDMLQMIEQQQGRVRAGERWGPRTLDLDLLMYGEDCIDSARLQVPHPGISERSFVLLPWREIGPDVTIPGLGRVDRLAAVFSEDAVIKLPNPPR